MDNGSDCAFKAQGMQRTGGPAERTVLSLPITGNAYSGTVGLLPILPGVGLLQLNVDSAGSRWWICLQRRGGGSLVRRGVVVSENRIRHDLFGSVQKRPPMCNGSSSLALTPMPARYCNRRLRSRLIWASRSRGCRSALAGVGAEQSALRVHILADSTIFADSFLSNLACRASMSIFIVSAPSGLRRILAR